MAGWQVAQLLQTGGGCCYFPVAASAERTTFDISDQRQTGRVCWQGRQDTFTSLRDDAAYATKDGRSDWTWAHSSGFYRGWTAHLRAEDRSCVSGLWCLSGC